VSRVVVGCVSDPAPKAPHQGNFRARNASRRGEKQRFSPVFARERREKRVDGAGSVVSRPNYVLR